jgi:hypothetical protein
MATFDGLQRTAVNKVNNLYAEAGSWTPSAGGSPITGKVLFENPTRAMELSGMEFDPKAILAEYFEPDFTGLDVAANSGLNEVLVINGVPYNVRQVLRKYDGKTNLAILEKP